MVNLQASVFIFKMTVATLLCCSLINCSSASDYPDEYMQSENLHNKLTISHCLNLDLVVLLNKFYLKNMRYPSVLQWAPYIISEGYPGKGGCYSYNKHKNSKILDNFGDQIVYTEMNSQEVILYSIKLREETGNVFKLKAGKLISIK